MKIDSFFSELKRRNVIRAAGLYLVGAWLLTQVASTVLPMFGAPDWLPRSIVLLLAIGFVPAVIFSWIFEMTPQGLRRDEDVPAEQSIAPQTGRRMDRMIIAVLVLALGYFAIDKFVLAPRKDAAESHSTVTTNASGGTANGKSIAVLPFENLSDEKSNAYFAEGIQDEILTRLSKIAALKVISRTSTQKYKSAPDNLHEVGQQLGVANLLEGSVQKAGNAVHINVQLIEAATDAHLWAESYDRELQNIFGVEGEVASAIAEQLKAKLSGSEKQQLAVKPTQNPEAYDAYLRGLAFQGRVDGLAPNTFNSIKAFAEAVRLDPEFGLAWAQLSRQHAFASVDFETTPEHREAARHALELAAKLAPNLLETQLAEGYYQYWVERDFEKARKLFEEVRRQYPNEHSAPEALAGIARREGDWQRSHELYAQAIELDPQNVFLLADATITEMAMRNVASAKKLLERALTISPGNSLVIGMLATTYDMVGDIVKAKAVLATTKPADGDGWYLNVMASNAIVSREYQPAIAVLKAQLAKPETLRDAVGSTLLSLGDLQRHSGDAEAAANSYQQARAALQTALASQPANADLLSNLAFADTWLGDETAALTHARQAIALRPSAKDAYTGPTYEEALARTQAHFGDKDDAITTLQHLLSIPYGPPPITPAFLRIDPDWDPLRGDPRFEKLCEERSN